MPHRKKPVLKAGDKVEVPAVSAPPGAETSGLVLTDSFHEDGHASILLESGGVIEVPIGMITDPDKVIPEIPPMKSYNEE